MTKEEAFKIVMGDLLPNGTRVKVTTPEGYAVGTTVAGSDNGDGTVSFVEFDTYLHCEDWESDEVWPIADVLCVKCVGVISLHPQGDGVWILYDHDGDETECRVEVIGGDCE